MNKTFCDKCGTEIKGEQFGMTIRKGEDYTDLVCSVDLCRLCANKVIVGLSDRSPKAQAARRGK